MARILDMDKKYQIILIILLLCFAIVVVGTVGASFLSENNSDGEDIAYVNNEGNLAINYTHGKVFDINKKGKVEYGVTITNTTKEKTYYSIDLEILEHNKDFTVSVLDEDNKVINEVKIDDNYDGRVLNLFFITADKTVRYNIFLNLNKRTKVKGELSVINETLSSENFADILINNLSTGTAQSRVGSETSTIDEGLITGTDNKGTAYYFRGNVKNNYVKLGDHLFRIVRINGDGTVRLVMDGSIGNYAYNLNGIVAGQGFNSLAYFGNTTLLSSINTWVDINLKEYSSYLVNGDFCTDMDFSYMINGSYYSRAYERLYVDNAPMLECSTVYTGKAGLLSVDEVVYAGAYRNSINKSYYLYNPDIQESYLTLTGLFYNNGMKMININSNGSIGDGIAVGEKAAVRPVINISSAAKVNGKGTKNNPYVIVA